MKKDVGLDEDCDNKNILTAVLGAFILSNSKRIMNSFMREKTGFIIIAYNTETLIASI